MALLAPASGSEGAPQLPNEYTIKKGDALLRIVKKLLPSLNENERIYACLVLKAENNVKNINAMNVGFKLTIPSDLEAKCKNPNIDWKKVRGEFMGEWHRAEKKNTQKNAIKSYNFTERSR